MKRPLLLPLAITLALGAVNALALGLGPVQVKSRLNQPLDAEIPVIQGTPGEAAGLLVNLAGADDFARIGLDRSQLHVPLQFAVVKSAHGTVIKVTTKEPVSTPYLDFLVEANWPKGRLLREYTVLLDPPISAPVRPVSTTMPTPARSASPAERTSPPVHHGEHAAVAATRVAAHASPSTPTSAGRMHAGSYGPVEAGETLSGIAGSTGANEGVNLNKMMLAILKANPDAFFKDNINALKRGAVLRIPSVSEVNAIGSASEAVAQVRQQVEEWRSGYATTPVVAGAGSKQPETIASATAPKIPAQRPAARTTTKGRLELVPPKSGKDSVAMADHPGSGSASGSGADVRELKSELARTKESLATQEQSEGDLKARVTELEDLKTKNDHLISLKNSEIADLQEKLKHLQEESAKPGTQPAEAPVGAISSTSGESAAAKPAASETAAAAKNGKDEIWGSSKNAGTAEQPPHPASPSVVEPSNSTSGAGEPEQGQAATTTKAPSTQPSAPTGVVTPPPETANTIIPPAPPAVSKPPPPTKAVVPPAKAPAKPGTATVRPVSVMAPWYESSWVKPAAIGAAIILLLLGLFGLRRRKPVAAVARGSLADSFGESSLMPADDAPESTTSFETEEAHLLEQLESDPDDLGLHLELLGLYYSEREVSKFEAAAAEMDAHVTDSHAPEWLEAQAMGQELAPDNPLFAGAAHYDDADMHTLADDGAETPQMNPDHESAVLVDEPAEPVHGQGESFHLDSGAAFETPAVQAVGGDGHGFDFSNLPPLKEFHETGEVAPEPVITPVHAAHLDDDYVTGDDAIGTKLDLAKAYMDMGDPDGARSMLEEVVAEGNAMQQAEAHRLMADIR